MRKTILTAFFALALAAAPAQAAFIAIDDNDLGSITITAGDFEAGFFVDGVLLTTGLGNSASITFADSGHNISGSWIDLGVSVPGQRLDINFALPGDPTLATSGIEFGVTTDGTFAALNGSFGGFTGIPYFVSAIPTVVQDGHIELGIAPFLSVSFDSEAAAVPEPATLLLAVPALAMYARRRRR
jgi:hypothetical protein